MKFCTTSSGTVALVLLSSLFASACRDAAVSLAKRPSLAVAFQPRGVRESPSVKYPDGQQVVQDLQLLYANGFRSLVTYGATGILRRVPQMAREIGFDGTIVMGLWDPTSAEEIDAAIAQQEFVDGYCVGNEGLGSRYNLDQLGRAMAVLRRRTGKQATTSEPITRYIEGPDSEWLIDNSDWLFPIAHPVLVLGRGGQAAIDWITMRHDYLVAKHGKRVVLKEAGFPSDGAPWATEREQVTFFRLLLRTRIDFYFFEAFDQPDKHRGGPFPSTEQNWGLFRVDGTAKSVVGLVEELRPSGSSK